MDRKPHQTPGIRIAGSLDRLRDTIRTSALTLCVAMVSAGQAFAANSSAEICDLAAQRAASKTGVPLSVLMAITRTETGRKSGGQFRPWPWTVNMEGKGVWFDTPNEARDYAYKHFQRGARSFDVGCFQVNYKWHGEAFRSIDEMFDPQINANYAARFLRDLFYEKGSWEEAAGAYHSRTKKYADRYRKRFQSFRTALASLDGGETRQLPVPPLPDTSARPDEPRVNRFPLLLAASNQGTRLGSLVPISAGAGGLRLIDVGGN